MGTVIEHREIGIQNIRARDDDYATLADFVLESHLVFTWAMLIIYELRERTDCA